MRKVGKKGIFHHYLIAFKLMKKSMQASYNTIGRKNGATF